MEARSGNQLPTGNFIASIEARHLRSPFAAPQLQISKPTSAPAPES